MKIIEEEPGTAVLDVVLVPKFDFLHLLHFAKLDYVVSLISIPDSISLSMSTVHQWICLT